MIMKFFLKEILFFLILDILLNLKKLVKDKMYMVILCRIIGFFRFDFLIMLWIKVGEIGFL